MNNKSQRIHDFFMTHNTPKKIKIKYMHDYYIRRMVYRYVCMYICYISISTYMLNASQPANANELGYCLFIFKIKIDTKNHINIFCLRFFGNS